MYPPFPKCVVVDPADPRPPDPGGRSFPAAGCRPRPSRLHAGPGGAPEAHKPRTCTHRRRARSHEAPPLRLAQTSASSRPVHPLELGLPQGADTAPRPGGGRSPHLTEWKLGPGPKPYHPPPRPGARGQPMGARPPPPPAQTRCTGGRSLGGGRCPVQGARAKAL